VLYGQLYEENEAAVGVKGPRAALRAGRGGGFAVVGAARRVAVAGAGAVLVTLCHAKPVAIGIRCRRGFRVPLAAAGTGALVVRAEAAAAAFRSALGAGTAVHESGSGSGSFPVFRPGARRPVFRSGARGPVTIAAGYDARFFEFLKRQLVRVRRRQLQGCCGRKGMVAARALLLPHQELARASRKSVKCVRLLYAACKEVVAREAVAAARACKECRSGRGKRRAAERAGAGPPGAR
jgi:hypothetical protein